MNEKAFLALHLQHVFHRAQMKISEVPCCPSGIKDVSPLAEFRLKGLENSQGLKLAIRYPKLTARSFPFLVTCLRRLLGLTCSDAEDRQPSLSGREGARLLVFVKMLVPELLFTSSMRAALSH